LIGHLLISIMGGMPEVDPGAGHVRPAGEALGPPSTPSLVADRDRGPEDLVGILLHAYWKSLADDPLSALLFTALASLGGVLLVLLGSIAVYLVSQLVAAVW
jgi:hypothetical protein